MNKSNNITYEELKEHLKTVNEVDLLELLEIYSDELVDRFEDKIEAKYNKLLRDFEGDLRPSED